MLTGEFFSISDWQSEHGWIRAQLEINPLHKIFEGHFPGQPVVPGVCMLQIIKEILESALSTKLMLEQADHIKFLALIDPRKATNVHAEINFQITEESKILLSAILLNEEIVYMKMKGVFTQSL